MWNVAKDIEKLGQCRRKRIYDVDNAWKTGHEILTDEDFTGPRMLLRIMVKLVMQYSFRTISILLISILNRSIAIGSVIVPERR